MSEIITAVLAVAIAAQVAVMAKAGKDFLNSSLNASLYGKTRGGSTQEAKQIDNNYDPGGLESETETSYTYDDKNYGDNEEKVNENNEEELTAKVSSGIGVKLSI